MNNYQILAQYYDKFTSDVDYDKFVEFYIKIFSENNIKPKTILDLACGTATIAYKMQDLGYKIIATDISSDMLMFAMQKNNGHTPFFINQSMDKLQLSNKVDACYSSLDSINYIIDEDKLYKTFSNVYKYLNFGGIFIFDVNSIEKFENMSNKSFIRDDNDVFCAFTSDYNAKTQICKHEFNIFVKNTKEYSRYIENHLEKAYSNDFLKQMLEKVGFIEINFHENTAFSGRIFISAKRGDFIE